VVSREVAVDPLHRLGLNTVRGSTAPKPGLHQLLQRDDVVLPGRDGGDRALHNLHNSSRRRLRDGRDDFRMSHMPKSTRQSETAPNVVFCR
jgi:hypothetical protein